MEGFLTKQGQMIKSWKVRWFCLENNEIAYYKDQAKQKEKGGFVLTADSTIETTGDQDVHKNMFIIGLPPVDYKPGPRRINMRGGKFITVSADSPATRAAWMKAIQGVIDRLKKTRDAEAGYNQTHVEDNKHHNTAGAAAGSAKANRPKSESFARESESESESEGPAGGGHYNRPKRVPNTIRRLKKDESSTGVNANVFNMGSVDQEVDHLNSNGKTAGAAKRGNKSNMNASTSSNNLDSKGAPVPPEYNSDSSVSSMQDVRHPTTATQQSNSIKHTSFGHGGNRAKAHSVDQEGAPYDDDDCPLPNDFDTCILPSFQQSSNIPTGDDAVPSSSSNRKSISLKKNLYDNWVEVKTEDGQTYYYHKISRVTRWDKPEKHIAEAMESRLQESQKATDKALKERKANQEREQELLQEKERIAEESKRGINRAMKRWRLNKKTKEDLSFPELLRDLSVILPNDLLVYIYSDTDHKTTFDSLLNLSISSEPSVVKKTYMKVVRFIHPDKLPASLELESKLLCEQIFILLTEKFDLYRNAHSL